MYDFGLRIRQLRVEHKLSQAALGKRLGRSKSVICGYENNLRVPPLDVLVSMAAVFNVSLDYLVGLDKREMISVEGLTPSQRELLQALTETFKQEPSPSPGLTQGQQEILSGLLREFARR